MEPRGLYDSDNKPLRLRSLAEVQADKALQERLKQWREANQ